MKALLRANNYLPLLNGLIGDKLAEKLDSWAIKMSFRIEGKDISPADLSRTLKKKGTVIVLVHGLMADERIWRHLEPIEKKGTVLRIRFNTGLHISENGHALDELLDELDVNLHPKRLYLVGHSMGGLVIRSACHYGRENHRGWIKKVPSIFLIAVPNAGAALEKLGHVTSFTLRKIAGWHVGTIGNLLEQRSNGIKDLGIGAMLDEDWKHGKKKSFFPGKRAPVPPIPGIHYHILVGNLSKDEKSLMAKYFGDGLVTHSSAVGDTLLQVARVTVFPRTGHNAILRNREVIRYLQKNIR